MKPRQKNYTLFNNFEWFAKRHHNRLMRHLRDEQKRLEYALRVALKAAGVSILMLSAAFAQPPPTPPTPPPLSAQLRWTPPRDVIYEEIVTNVEPITVRVTISSNIVRQTIWWKGELPRTNCVVLESNIVSVVTNTLPL